jgi:hypothetical protein
MACAKELKEKLITSIQEDIKERYGLKSLNNLNKQLAGKIVNEMNNSILNERLLKLSYDSDMGEKGLANIEVLITPNFLSKTLKEATLQESIEAENYLNRPEVAISNQALLEQEDVDIEESDERFNVEIKRLNALKKKINFTIKNKVISDEEKSDLKDQIKDINKKIKSLSTPETQNLNEIIVQAYDSIQKAKAFLGKGVTRQNTDLARSYVLGYGSLLDTFDAEGLQKEKIQDILFEINKLIGQIVVAEKKYVKGVFERLTGKPWQEVVFDITGIELRTLDVSNSTSLLAQSVNKLIKSAETKIKTNFEIFNSKHKELSKKLEEETGLKGEEATDYMIDKDGNNTGFIINPYTYEYYQAEKNAKNDSFNSYIKWLHDNHNLELNQATWEIKQNYYKDIINNDSSILADDKQTVEQKKEAYINAKIKKNDPNFLIKYVEKIANNKATDEEIEYVKNYFEYNGWYFKGNTLINKKPIAKWEDKRYSDIQRLDENDIQKVFYNHFVDNLKESRKNISKYDDSTLPFSYIPEFEKTKAFWEGIPDKIKNSISEKVNDSSFEIKDILTGEVINHIPVNSLNGSLGVNEKSYDLIKVLEGFYYESLNKKYKEEIEDDANLMLAAIKNQELVEKDASGKIIYEIQGNISKPKMSVKDQSNIYLQAKYLLDVALYNKKQDKEGITNIKTYSEKDSKTIEKYKNLQKERGVTEENINDDLYYGLDEIESEDYKKALNNFKVVTGSKLANFFINLTVKKSLGFNFFGGITEYFQGLLAANVEAASGKYFNDSNFRRAFGLITWSNNPDVDSSKIDQLLDLFNTRESFNTIDKKLFWHLRKAERQTKGLITLAVLDNETVVIEDKEVKLLDIIDVKEGRITTKEGYKDVFGEFNEDNEYIPSKLRLDLEVKINAVIKRISSRDNSKDPILMNKSAMFRLIGQFRQSWMFEAINNRFGGEREVLGLEGSTKGFYRSVFEKGPKQGFKILFTVLQGKTYPGLEELDVQNAKKMLRELTWIMSTYTVYLVLSLMAGDDEDENEFNPVTKASLNYLINQTYRTNRDLTFYVSPESFQEITKNFIPAMKTASDFLSIVGAIKDIPFGDIYLYENTKKEEIKLFNKIEKAFPIINQPRKMYSWITNSDYTSGKK